MRDEKTSNSEMTAALEAWLNEVVATYQTRLGDIVQLLGWPRWHSDPAGGFRRYPHDVTYKYPALEDAIFGNSSTWAEVEKLSERHARLKQHSSEFVRSTNGSGRAYTLQELCKCLIPTIKLASEDTVAADTDFDVKARIDEFIGVLNADHIEHTTVWPIRGLATDAPIILDEWTEFRELTTEEKLHCLNFEIIRPFSISAAIPPEHSRWFGLCHRTLDKKTFGHDEQQDVSELTKRFADLEQILEDFLVTVPLVTDRVAYHAGGFQGAPHFELGRFLVFGITGRGVGSANDMHFSLGGGAENVNDEVAAEICETWAFIRASKNGSFKKRVGNAARRLFYAETRFKKEDVLVDLMVAAESLYLNSDKNELRFRMSLNAALWADVDGIEKRKIFGNFIKAYDLRSKVVHGSEATQESVTESISLIKSTLLEGIRKALSHLKTTSDAPYWEKMIFPDDIAGDTLNDSADNLSSDN